MVPALARKSTPPYVAVMPSFSRAWPALTFCLLAPLQGCGGKSKKAQAADAIAPDGAPALDLASRPQLLFQVFGDRDNQRMAPLAAVVKGVIRPIGLTPSGWRTLDSLYFSPGAKYPVYNDGVEVGEVVVTRGMWTNGGKTLYPLQGCTVLRPLAAVRITIKQARTDQYTELVASSVPLAVRGPFKGTLPSDGEIAATGREFGWGIARTARIPASELDSLDFHARLLITGASSDPTLLVSFIDPNAGDLGPGTGHTTHLFALGEKAGATYEPTYRHSVSGDGKSVEFQRIIDHLDVSGSGVDDLILEAWRYGAENDLLVLSFRAGRWRETVRAKQSYCLDPVPPQP